MIARYDFDAVFVMCTSVEEMPQIYPVLILIGEIILYPQGRPHVVLSALSDRERPWLFGRGRLSK